jgi:hypothetical protein
MSMHTQRHWLAIALLVFLGTLVAAASASHPNAQQVTHAAARAPMPAAALLPAGDSSVPAAASVFSAAGAAADQPASAAPTF